MTRKQILICVLVVFVLSFAAGLTLSPVFRSGRAVQPIQAGAAEDEARIADQGRSQPDSDFSKSRPAPAKNENLPPIPAPLDSGSGVLMEKDGPIDVPAVLSVLSSLGELVRSPLARNPGEVLNLLPLLGLCREEDAAAVIEQLAVGHPDAVVRAAAVGAIKDLGKAHVLTAAVQDPDGVVRESAVRKMFQLEDDNGPQHFHAAISELLAHEQDVDTLNAAVAYLDFYAENGTQLAAQLEGLMRRPDLPEDVLEHVVKAIQEYEDTPVVNGEK